MPAPPPPAEPAAFHRLRADNSCHLSIGGHDITIPHHPTNMWLAYLADQALHRVFPGMLRRQDEAWIHAQLADHDTAFDVPQIRQISRAVVAEVTGLPWYVAARLASVAGTGWFLADPVALMRGIDMLALPVRRTLSVVYLLQREGAKDDNERAYLDRELWAIPNGEKPSWTPEQQSSSFAEFRAMRAAIGARAAAPR
jgi:hypothetical protein